MSSSLLSDAEALLGAIVFAAGVGNLAACLDHINEGMVWDFLQHPAGFSSLVLTACATYFVRHQLDVGDAAKPLLRHPYLYGVAGAAGLLFHLEFMAKPQQQ